MTSSNKKSIILCLILCPLIGILSWIYGSYELKRQRKIESSIVRESGYKIVTIDGCEYIEVELKGFAHGITLIHKANCKNHKK